jgi:hypothetical protein
METFDFKNNYAVGLLRIKPNGNGYVDVRGYIDSSQKFHYLSKEQSREMFPPRGGVFAHNVRNYGRLEDKYVQLRVMANQKDGYDLDAYIWDKSEEIIEIGKKVHILNQSFSDDGQDNYDKLFPAGLLGKSSDVYFSDRTRLYLIKGGNNQRLIHYCSLSDVDLIHESYENIYYIGCGLPVDRGCIDVTTDEQLIDWFLKNVVTVDFDAFKSGDKGKVIAAVRDSLLKGRGLTEEVKNARISRLSRLQGIHNISDEDLSQIAKATWLNDSLAAAIQKSKDKYLEDARSSCNADLEEYKNEIENKKKEFQDDLDSINLEVEIANEELEKLRNSISSQNAELAKKKGEIEAQQKALDEISSRKDSIIRDFQVVRDVFGMTSSKDSLQTDLASFTLETAEYSSKETVFEGFRRSLESCLKSLSCEGDAQSIADLLAAYKILLLPDIRTVMAIIHATGRCRYIMSYVGVAWKSFDDLWKNGLGFICAKCAEAPDVIHYLVLRGINLSYIPNYLQPVFDLQSGCSTCFQGTSQCFPDNLRILTLAAADSVIPMSSAVLANMGCAAKKETAYQVLPGAFSDGSFIKSLKGFLTAEELNSPENRNIGIQNCYEDYAADQS